MDHGMQFNASNNAYEVLYDRERIELDGCLQNIQLFRKYIDDYQCLKERLETLADKTSYDIMVPIAGSKLAFMPGYIHHTNEVLVLIGDNYFVEKSTKEAMAFVDRKMAFCCTKIEELESQQKMLQNWLDATADMKTAETTGLVDINETWTEEEVQEWQVKHQHRVKEHRKKLLQKSANLDTDQILNKYEREEMEVGMDTIPQGSEARQKLPSPAKPLLVEQQLASLSVSERKEPAAPPPSTGNNLGLEGNSEKLITQRPISKFKASRMKK